MQDTQSLWIATYQINNVAEPTKHNLTTELITQIHHIKFYAS